jgi:hypothetical protein
MISTRQRRIWTVTLVVWALALIVWATVLVMIVRANAAVTHCGVTAHRLGPTATIDDNTLEGLTRSTRLGARGETDLLPTTDGFVLFHQKRWEQGTTGIGVPWETTSAYADGLTTTGNSQQVPLFSKALTAAKNLDSRLLIEAHYWTEAWTPNLLEAAVGKVQQRGLTGQVWWTGTNAMMMALADIAPEATTVWRVDNDQTPTQAYVDSRSIEVLQVTPQTSAADINLWRSWGLRVTGRNTTVAEYQTAYNHGLRTVQTPTGGGIRPWLDYCEGGGA